MNFYLIIYAFTMLALPGSIEPDTLLAISPNGVYSAIDVGRDESHAQSHISILRNKTHAAYIAVPGDVCQVIVANNGDVFGYSYDSKYFPQMCILWGRPIDNGATWENWLQMSRLDGQHSMPVVKTIIPTFSAINYVALDWKDGNVVLVCLGVDVDGKLKQQLPLSEMLTPPEYHDGRPAYLQGCEIPGTRVMMAVAVYLRFEQPAVEEYDIVATFWNSEGQTIHTYCLPGAGRMSELASDMRLLRYCAADKRRVSIRMSDSRQLSVEVYGEGALGRIDIDVVRSLSKVEPCSWLIPMPSTGSCIPTDR